MSFGMKNSLALIGSAVATLCIVSLLQLQEMGSPALPMAMFVALPYIVTALLFLFGVILRLVLRDWSARRVGLIAVAASVVALCVLLLAVGNEGLSDGFLVIDILRAPEVWTLLLAPVAGVLFMSVVSALADRGRRSSADCDPAHS